MSRNKRGADVSGWVVLDKPRGLGSTPAVSAVRRAFDARKAGHAGTLDPLAEGVLPIALGEATKTVAHLMDASKAYRFEIAWGAETASFDFDGPVTARSDVRPSPDAVAAALQRRLGEREQVPPAYSAVRVEGARAYDLARAGEAPALAPRRVRLDSARVVGARDADHVEIEIACGKGYYVRALARDLALDLGACACVSRLRRTRVGPFDEARAVPLETLAEMCDRGLGSKELLPVETALDDIPALAVTDEDAFRLSQGRPIVILPGQVETLFVRRSDPSGPAGARTVVLATRKGLAAALCEARDGQLRPIRVFNL